MNRMTKRVLFWSPRVLCVLFAAFISIFALDVFDEPLTPWQAVEALTMHLLPTFLILGVLVLSWKREWVGGIVYIGLGLLYVFTVGRRFPWIASLLVGGPPVVMGLLFFANWARHDELRAA